MISRNILLIAMLAGAGQLLGQSNSYPLYSSGAYAGGTGDYTNITGAQLRLEASSGYLRIPHVSASASVSAVFNFQTGKHAYWGEPTDVGNYFFRGRNLIVEQGKLGIGNGNPVYMLDVVGPANDWKAKFSGSDGYITIGPANEGWAHIYTDRPNFIFNQNLWSITGGFSSYSTADLNLQTNGVNRVTVSNSNGNVGIGTTSPDQKLTVNGNIHAKEVKVDLSVPGPDYVFDEDYQLTPLEELKKYIDEHRHLPEVPSAKEMEVNGINLMEMNVMLLKKVEELTLHVIEQQNQLTQLREAGRVSAESSAKKVEELTLHVIRLKNELDEHKCPKHENE